MFDWNSVGQALSGNDLAEGLFRLEQFAKSSGNAQLADWVHLELEGYTPTEIPDEDIPEYRKVEISDRSYYFNHQAPLNEKNNQQLEQRHILREGVRYLTRFLQTGLRKEGA